MVLCWWHLVSGVEAKKLFDEAQAMLSRIVRDHSLQCRGIIGFWKGNAVGDDIHVYDESDKHIATFFGLRQQVFKITLNSTCNNTWTILDFILLCHLLISLAK